MKNERRMESQKVKTALAEGGVNARVKFGSGSTFHWLKVRILGEEWSPARLVEVERLAQAASGRENISVDFD